MYSRRKDCLRGLDETFTNELQKKGQLEDNLNLESLNKNMVALAEARNYILEECGEAVTCSIVSVPRLSVLEDVDICSNCKIREKNRAKK